MALAESDDAVTVTLSLEGGRLPASGIVVSDRNLADGSARVELWQGGITSSAAEDASGGLEARLDGATGRVALVLSAEPDAFRTIDVRRSANGRSQRSSPAK